MIAPCPSPQLSLIETCTYLNKHRSQQMCRQQTAIKAAPSPNALDAQLKVQCCSNQSVFFLDVLVNNNYALVQKSLHIFPRSFISLL